MGRKVRYFRFSVIREVPGRQPQHSYYSTVDPVEAVQIMDQHRGDTIIVCRSKQ